MSTPEKIADVLLVLPVLHPSGAERVLAELALRLPRFGFPATVMCLEDDDAAIGLELKRADVRVIGLHRSRRQSFGCARGIVDYLKMQNLTQPMIVCSHLYHANAAVRIAASRLPDGIRKFVRVLNTIHVAERRFRPWQFWFERLTMKYAAYDICIARSVAEFHRRKTGLPEAFFKVIENGIDLSRYADPSTNSVARPAGKFRVVSVGRLNPQKDFPTLLRAWKIVSENLPGARLEIAGSGAEESRLKQLCADLNLTSVSWIGFCSDVPAFLSGADVYVQSSAWEGMPLTVLEAMAAGLPAVASNVDSLPEIIDNGRTGVLFERGNASDLAARILELLGDFSRAKAMGAAAREHALQRFSAERMAADYARLFQHVLLENPA